MNSTLELSNSQLMYFGDEIRTLMFSESSGAMSKSYKTVIATITVLTMTIGVLANVVLLGVMLRPLKRQSLVRPPKRTNDISIQIFVAVLAADDILMGITNGTMLLMATLRDSEWIFGEPLCKFREPLSNAVVGVSCWMMMVIAYERYCRLLNHQRIMTDNLKRTAFTVAVHAGIVVATIVAIHSLFSIPAILNGSVDTIVLKMPFVNQSTGVFFYRDINLGSYCVQTWDWPWLFVIYSIIGFLLSFCVPLGVTVYIHAKVIAFLKDSVKKVTVGGKYLRKTTYILIAVLISFSLCWSPFRLTALIVNIKTSGVFADPSLPGFLFEPAILHTFRLLTIAQTCLNPLLYGWFIARRKAIASSRESTDCHMSYKNTIHRNTTAATIATVCDTKQTIIQ